MTTDQAPTVASALSGKRRLVLVTGPSGAGRSSALNVLEDAGFEAIDNLPLRMLPALLKGQTTERSVALGIDARNRDFSTTRLLDLIGEIAASSDVMLELLYLDCADDILLRRFSETRRRHPLAPADSPGEGILLEKKLLAPIRERADVLIDSSNLNIHQLRAEVEHWFAPDGRHYLAVSVQSFSYKRGLPRSVDIVHDCRFLRNPYWEPALRKLNGTHPDVADFVAQDARYKTFADTVFDLSALLLPAFREEGKSHIAIAFGCTGGQHRSVTLAEDHALRLAEQGWQVSIRHRELDRQQPEEN
ncbi:RNase adapter RapZ [Sulfitobacter aestuariivivens]|uniref:RNase adapter RapZ n=1 Tax=Sulfitobacter aestuariivivens TaxID=2766981 RepID=A0A927D967_9RHOB|nr:RNase adapter RapZ [Sulfitobacter aestuariivivens]MBD3665942.1 RNase adapter RapZ [Sulfitobacter aestuariivivens]